MNAERLLELYDNISEAPDAVARLRRFVLDLAVRGKLVEQEPTDEPASILVRQLISGKESLIKSKTIKKPRELGSDDELVHPHDIPTTWQWCRLDTVGAIVGGGTPSAGDVSNFDKAGAGVAWLTPADLGGYSGLYISHGARDLSDKGLASSSATLMPAGSVLFTSRAPIGYVAIAEGPIATNQGFKSVVPYKSGCSQFVALTLKALAPDIDAKASGTTFKEVSGKIVAGIPFPLPPLAEQHRIVAKVDELMGLCDRLEEARKEREATRDRLTTASLARLTAPDTTAEDFPAHTDFALNALPALTTRPDQIKSLRQTILNLAVRGKLVEQEPADEPAGSSLERLKQAAAQAFRDEGLRARKPVAVASREDLTFEFPKSWELPIFDDIFVMVSGVTKGGKVSLQDAQVRPYLRVANVQRGHLDLGVIKTIEVKAADANRYRLKDGDILMTEGGDWDKLGRAAIWRSQIDDCIHQNHVFRVRPPSGDILAEWVITYVNSELGRLFFEDASKQTTNLASINMTQLRGCPLPLPPLAEQRRIVAKVDELMALCDQLEAALTKTDTTRTRLLEALLHEALEPSSSNKEAVE